MILEIAESQAGDWVSQIRSCEKKIQQKSITQQDLLVSSGGWEWSWPTSLINPALHVQSGRTNVKSMLGQNTHLPTSVSYPDGYNVHLLLYNRSVSSGKLYSETSKLVQNSLCGLRRNKSMRSTSKGDFVCCVQVTGQCRLRGKISICLLASPNRSVATQRMWARSQDVAKRTLLMFQVSIAVGDPKEKKRCLVAVRGQRSEVRGGQKRQQ